MKNEFKTKYGTVKIGTDGYYKVTSRKEGNTGKLWHRLIWEDFYGCPVPDGYIVHHKNGNKLDNCILNLQLLNRKEHSRLHHKGKKLSEEHKQKISKAKKNPSMEIRRKISESQKGEKNHNWKSYARIKKNGINNGKQMYAIMKDGKTIKQSVYPIKLVNWFTENYPNEILVLSENEECIN